MGNLSDTIKNIEKTYGKEAISGNSSDNVHFVSSGILSLDLALGGGFPKGRLIEVYGSEGSSKTTMAITLATQIQKLGKAVCYIDMEQAMDLFYATNLGLDLSKDKWIMSQPDSGEEGLSIAKEFIRCEDIGLVVIDSVAALTPKAVIDGAVGDAKIGLLARIMSQTLPTMLNDAKKNETIVLFLNQIRKSIGIVYGNPNVTPGGEALKFYTSQRIELSRVGQNKDGEDVVSNKIRAKVQKNKVAPPFRKANFDVLFGEGYDIQGEIIDLSADFNIIKKAGSWYSYGEIKLGQGKDSVRAVLKDNPELFEELKEKVINEISK